MSNTVTVSLETATAIAEATNLFAMGSSKIAGGARGQAAKLHMAADAGGPTTACGQIPMHREPAVASFPVPVTAAHICGQCIAYWNARQATPLDPAELATQATQLLA